MKLLTTMTAKADLPPGVHKKFYRIFKKFKHTVGKSELIHPLGFYEIIVLRNNGQDKRISSHPNIPNSKYWKPKRPNGLEGYDFDTKLRYLSIYVLLTHIERYKKIEYRTSTTGRGLHIITKTDALLTLFDDQTRRRATNLRGYDWYFNEKKGYCAFNFQKTDRVIDIIKLAGFNDKKERRKPSRKKIKKLRLRQLRKQLI